MTKNLNLGNFLTISRSNISKLQIFLKNRFHSNWKSYLVLTSGQKPKKSLGPFLRKISKCPIFKLIWRPFRKCLQIKTFFSQIQVCHFSTSRHPILTSNTDFMCSGWRRSNNTDFLGPGWRRSKNVKWIFSKLYVVKRS